MLLAPILRLLLVVLSVACRTAQVEHEEDLEDSSGLEMCMTELSETFGDIYEWVSMNPSLLVSLALSFNRTGSCSFDDLLPDTSGNQPGSPLRVQQGTRTYQRRQEGASTPTDLRPTPAPTGASSVDTTVHIADEHNFSLLLPGRQGGTHDAQKLHAFH